MVNPAIVEANLGDDMGQTFMKENAAGSGPFTQGRWEIGNIYEFIAVDDYWAGWTGDDHLDGFFWIIQRDAATQLNSLLAGETHIADTVAASDKEKIIDSPDHVWEEHGGFFTNTLKMNNQGEYTSDIHLRMAVAHAMNYEAMVDAQDVKITILPGPTPANFVGYVEGLAYPKFDLDAARAHLAQSAWPEGGITLDYVYVTEFPREEIPGLILLEGLAEIGIELNMIPMLWPDMVASCATPETGPDIINIYTLPPFLDPDAHLYNQYHSDQWGSFNSCSFYQNERGERAAGSGAYDWRCRDAASDVHRSAGTHLRRAALGLDVYGGQQFRAQYLRQGFRLLADVSADRSVPGSVDGRVLSRNRDCCRGDPLDRPKFQA